MSITCRQLCHISCNSCSLGWHAYRADSAACMKLSTLKSLVPIPFNCLLQMRLDSCVGVECVAAIRQRGRHNGEHCLSAPQPDSLSLFDGRS